MHDSLLIVPNISFYGNKIESKYLQPQNKNFLYLDSPFIFIDVCDNAQDKRVGTSYMNASEVTAIKNFTTYWLNLVH